MILDYSQQATIRDSAVLTSSYVAGTVLSVPLKNQLIIYVLFTKGLTTSMEMKVEFSQDNSSWYQEVEEFIDSGTATVRELTHQVASANQSAAQQGYKFSIPITDRYVRISVKGTGVMTNSLVQIDASLGVSGN